MKFDCGETFQEKEERLKKWHDFFTILPREVGEHDCRWLETIERRGFYHCSYAGCDWFWQYRAKQ